MVAEEFEAGRIKGPIHLSGGNEEKLIEIFREVGKNDWVFSTWRNHFHALLHGVPEDVLMAEIMAGRSMNLSFPERKFYSSAIVAGILPIACGVAAGIKRRGGSERVWCFIGDMAASTGTAHEVCKYAQGHALPLCVVVEDNWYSTNTPTALVWGASDKRLNYRRYTYERTYPHSGIGKWVQF